jgi:transcription elongation factor Elf1
MTSETKKFIELGDVLSLRFECKHCDSELMISSLRDIGKQEEHGKLDKCPVCGRDWACVSGSSCEMTIAKFLESLNALRGVLKSFPAGFYLTLEVKNERQVGP